MWLRTERADSCTSGAAPSAHAAAMKALSCGQEPAAWNSAPSRPTREQSLRRREGGCEAEPRQASRPALTCSRASREKWISASANSGGRYRRASTAHSSDVGEPPGCESAATSCVATS